MRLTSLGISHLRNIEMLHLELQPGINVFVGPNGGGKTSILEGAYLLSHAQSFRTGSVETVVSRGAEQMQLRGRVERDSGAMDLRLTRSKAGWTAQVNGGTVPSLADLLQEFAMVCLEPGSHALISGGSRERRQFLDWGVFHVEPDFWADVRQYNRALRQRNAALKQLPAQQELDTWDVALVERALPVVAKRRRYFEGFQRELEGMLRRFLPEMGEPQAVLDDGTHGTDLLEVLRARRALDILRGHTSRGPHRADWRIAFQSAPLREHLSRGQEKLCALACVLAQAELFAHARGEWPVIALDDLASELDQEHQTSVMELALSTQAQLLITGTDLPAALQPFAAAARMFHVEHGKAYSLL